MHQEIRAMERTAYPTDTAELAKLLSPYSVDSFLGQVQSRVMLHVPGDATKASSYFSWNELNHILAKHRLGPPRLRLAADGLLPDVSRLFHPSAASGGLVRRGLDASALDLEALYERLRDGTTLVLDAVDEATTILTGVCAGLSRCFLTHAQANAYISFGETAGFCLHWDDHDVIVLQIAGRKAWRVFEPTLDRPLAHDQHSERPPTGTPFWDGELCAGDTLYLPRGWWHAPRGVGERSLHLTFTLPLPTGLDVLDWLLQRAAQSAIARQDLPSRAPVEDRLAFTRALRSEFNHLWGENAIDAYLDYRAGRLSCRPSPCLPEAVGDGGLPESDNFAARYNGIAATIARPIFDMAGTENDEPPPARITLAGRECAVDLRLLPAMERLLSGEPVSFAEFRALTPDTVGRDGLRALLGGLVAAGLIDILPESRRA